MHSSHRIASISKVLANSRRALHIERVVVIGAGLMGSGIVQIAAQAGYQVTMCDQSQVALDKGKAIITKSLERIAKKSNKDRDEFVNSVFAKISMTTDLDASVKKTDLVIEAIIESLAIKQALFKSLDKQAHSETIFVSNTSSLPIKSIAESTHRPHLFAGLHFFNPVPQMKLVEIISTEQTHREVTLALTEFALKIGKTPVNCKDTPGFIVNRLLVPYMMEALRMFERGDATKEDIDTGMKLGAGYPMGPFELIDYVGLDTTKFITDGWRDAKLLDETLVKKSPILDQMVAEKKLGRKNGEGFYNYK